MLLLSDLPDGWTAAEAAEGEGEDEAEVECLEELQPDLSDLTVTGDAQSDDFSQEAAQLGSSATIYQTEEQAKAAFDRVVDLIAGQEAIDCLVSGIQEGAEEEAGVQIEFGEASGSAVSFPEVAEQTEAIVLEIPFAVEGQEFSGFLEFVFMREERALGGLFGFDLMTPIPADEQEGLAQIVAIAWRPSRHRSEALAPLAAPPCRDRRLHLARRRGAVQGGAIQAACRERTIRVTSERLGALTQ